MDYAAFAARITAAAAEDLSVDVDLATVFPGLIEASELQCLRDLDPLSMRSRATLTASAGMSVITVLPATWWIPRRLQLVGPPRGRIERRDPSFLDLYAPDPTVTGVPKYWTMQDEATIQLAPTPAGALQILAEFTGRPATLSASNPTTWLSLNYPDLLFFAGMDFMNGFQKNYGAGDDPKAAAYWQGKYQAALAGARLEESRKKGQPPVPNSPTPPNAQGA